MKRSGSFLLWVKIFLASVEPTEFTGESLPDWDLKKMTVLFFLKKLLFIWKLRLWWFAIVSLLLKARQLSYQMATSSLMASKFAEEISKPINQICVMPLSGIIRGNLLFNVNQMMLVSTVITLDNPNVELPPPPLPRPAQQSRNLIPISTFNQHWNKVKLTRFGRGAGAPR